MCKGVSYMGSTNVPAIHFDGLSRQLNFAFRSKQPEAPVECALLDRPSFERGSGAECANGRAQRPVSGVVDVNGRANVAGAPGSTWRNA